MVLETGAATDWDTVGSGETDLCGADYIGIEALLLMGTSATGLTGGGSVREMTGNIGTNTLYGVEASETLSGGGDADSLYGGGGDDVACGDEGNDVIDGGDGADTITGGLGNDTMSGGAMADVFVFDTPDTGSIDQIDGFDDAVDRIDLVGLAILAVRSDTEGFLGGGQASVTVTTGATASTVGLDTDGDGIQDQQIDVTGLHDLIANGAFLLA